MSELEYTEKVCSDCGEVKHVTEFYRTQNRCKPCHNVKSREYTAKRTKEQRKRQSLRTLYGITLEQYNELLQKQGESCAVCDRPQSDFNKALAVDHNHKTGEIRGLLCTNCNHRLVGRHRDGDLLRKMADYVEQGTGWFVPDKRPKKKRKRKVKDKSES